MTLSRSPSISWNDCGVAPHIIRICYTLAHLDQT
jgi:hypothetical protein